MTKDFKVLWTENAIEDLLAIKEYISEDSPARAETWIIELFKSGESLVNLPLRGRIVPEFKQENLRELLIDNYRLVYRIKKISIEIVTVFEGHRQLNKKDLKK
ncbi:MAG: type II toxin-antitoxin system RelE/ParE family toxin [Pseudobdellovibrionaceae bacterium]